MFDIESSQKNLISKIRTGKAKYIELDPDGTGSNWLGVIIKAETGIIYAHQCAGTSNNHYLYEGYFVPIDGCKVEAADGNVSSTELTRVFHCGKSCSFGFNQAFIINNRKDELERVLKNIPFWDSNFDDTCTNREPLQIDHEKINWLCEAWVPVITAQGPGILVWQNCD